MFVDKAKTKLLKYPKMSEIARLRRYERISRRNLGMLFRLCGSAAADMGEDEWFDSLRTEGLDELEVVYRVLREMHSRQNLLHSAIQDLTGNSPLVDFGFDTNVETLQKLLSPYILHETLRPIVDDIRAKYAPGRTDAAVAREFEVAKRANQNESKKD